MSKAADAAVDTEDTVCIRSDRLAVTTQQVTDSYTLSHTALVFTFTQHPCLILQALNIAGTLFASSV